MKWSHGLVLALSAALLGCGSDADSAADAGAVADASSQPTADASSGGSDAGDGSGCTGECATMALVAEFGDTTRTFDRAFFGLTSPANSDSGAWELYIENNTGDDDQCPTMKSPTPEFLLLLAGMPLQSEDPGPVTATANLIDFGGALLTSSIREEATSNTVTWVSHDPCVACAEGTEDDRASRHLAVDVEATFSEGTISGHVYATHCDSLDVL